MNRCSLFSFVENSSCAENHCRSAVSEIIKQVSLTPPTILHSKSLKSAFFFTQMLVFKLSSAGRLDLTKSCRLNLLRSKPLKGLKLKCLVGLVSLEKEIFNPDETFTWRNSCIGLLLRDWLIRFCINEQLNWYI